jgi:hypothetical protein
VIFIGELKNGKETEGKEYQLQEDGTHSLFEYPSMKAISSGHKTE